MSAKRKVTDGVEHETKKGKKTVDLGERGWEERWRIYGIKRRGWKKEQTRN